jgi:hypothetical protein
VVRGIRESGDGGRKKGEWRRREEERPSEKENCGEKGMLKAIQRKQRTVST